MTIDHDTAAETASVSAPGVATAPVDAAGLAEIVTFVWDVFVGGDISYIDSDASASGAPKIDGGVCTSISIGGCWTATIIACVSDELAMHIASSLLGMAHSELDDELINDAFGELANVVGGNVKGLLADEGSSLSLPVVGRWPQVIHGPHRTTLAEFVIDGHAMTWEIHEPN
jgi:chemotaxis protein CheX